MKSLNQTLRGKYWIFYRDYKPVSDIVNIKSVQKDNIDL